MTKRPISQCSDGGNRLRQLSISLKEVLELRNNTLFGLDIGSNFVKAVQLNKEADTYRPTGAACAAIDVSHEDDQAARNAATASCSAR